MTEPVHNAEESGNEENVIYLGDEKPVILKPQKSRSRGNSESKNKQQKVNPRGELFNAVKIEI